MSESDADGMTKARLEIFRSRHDALLKDDHLRAQVERLMPALTLINGTKDARTLDECMEFAAVSVARLETNPELDFSGIYGGIAAVRGPMEGYGLVIWASDVFAMRLGNGTFDGLNYWNDGETARHSARDTDA